MAEKSIEFSYDESVLDYLTKKSYSVTYGARNLRRTIQKDIEDKVAADIIDHYDAAITRIGITAAEDRIQVLVV